MSGRDSGGPGVGQPETLVYEAYRNCAEQRERVSVAPLVPDDVLDTRINEVEYHGAVMEYFNRLMPHLPDRPQYWEQIELFSMPSNGEREALAQHLAEFYNVDVKHALWVLDIIEHSDKFENGFQGADKFQPPDDEGTVRGLKSLKHWRNRTYQEEVTETDIIEGKTTRVVTQQEYLPRDVAMRVHDILDEAASKLGYNTRPGKDVTRTRVDEDGFNVEEVRTKK